MSLKERAARADLAGKALSKNRPPKPEPEVKSEPKQIKKAKPPRRKAATTPATAARYEAAKQFGLPQKTKAKSAAERQAERRANICQLNVELSPVQRAKLDAIADSQNMNVKTLIQTWIEDYVL